MTSEESGAVAGMGGISMPRQVPLARTGSPWHERAILVIAFRVLLLIVLLLLWEYLPTIKWLRSHVAVFDPFFISAPSLVLRRLADLAVGAEGQPLLWPYIGDTLAATFLGVLIGTMVGALFGLFLSNSKGLQKVLSPYITLMNATPRIALIPIFVIVAGPTMTASVLTAVAVVFFVVFYNAYAGGLGVSQQSLQNARLLGATSREVMRHIRLPYVLVWTFTSLPNAISFGLVAVVTAEILNGQRGMGRLLFNSISAVDSTLTFCVVVVLSAIGVCLVTAADALQARLLRWWERSL